MYKPTIAERGKRRGGEGTAEEQRNQGQVGLAEKTLDDWARYGLDVVGEVCVLASGGRLGHS